MNASKEVTNRLAELIRRRNRELAGDAALKAGLGIVFGLLAFGFIFWGGWLFGILFAWRLGLEAWQFAAIITSAFFIAATWSAWHRVNPLAGLEPLSDRQLLLSMIGQVSGEFMYFSPRHATAGAAMMLLGGPANVFEGIGIWIYRIRVDAALLEEAARLLESCRTEFPIKQIREPNAAFILRRLALIKGLPKNDPPAITATQKGLDVLSAGKGSKTKRNAESA